MKKAIIFPIITILLFTLISLFFPKQIKALECGINIDPANSRGLGGHPNAATLGNTGWVRIEYKDCTTDNPISQASLNTYRNVLSQYKAAGIKTIVILDYLTYPNASSNISEFAARSQQIASNLGDVIDAYEIWNEPDHPRHFPLAPNTFKIILDQVGSAVKSGDTSGTNTVVLGGLASGNHNYVTALNGIPSSIDAVAIHPYVNGVDGYPPGSPGDLRTTLNNFLNVSEGRPIWITEMGLDTDNNAQVAEYIRRFYNLLNNEFSSTVPVVTWFAWSDNMVPPFGLVDPSWNPKDPYDNHFIYGCGFTSSQVPNTFQNLPPISPPGGQSCGGTSDAIPIDENTGTPMPWLLDSDTFMNACSNSETDPLTSRPSECGICKNYMEDPTNSCVGNFTYHNEIFYNSGEGFTCTGARCEYNDGLAGEDACSVDYPPMYENPGSGELEFDQLLIGPKSWQGAFTLNAETVILPYAGNNYEESRERYIADYLDGTNYYRVPLDPASQPPPPEADPQPIYGNDNYYNSLTPQDPRYVSYSGIFQKLAPQTYQDSLKHKVVDRAAKYVFANPSQNFTIQGWTGETTTAADFYTLPPNPERKKPQSPIDSDDYQTMPEYLQAVEEWKQLDNGFWYRLWNYVPIANREDSPGYFVIIPQQPASVVPASSNLPTESNLALANPPLEANTILTDNRLASILPFSPSDSSPFQGEVGRGDLNFSINKSSNTQNSPTSSASPTLLAQGELPPSEVECFENYLERGEDIQYCSPWGPSEFQENACATPGTYCDDIQHFCRNLSCSAQQQQDEPGNCICPDITPAPDDTQEIPPFVKLQLPHLYRLWYSAGELRKLLHPRDADIPTAQASTNQSSLAQVPNTESNSSNQLAALQPFSPDSSPNNLNSLTPTPALLSQKYTPQSALTQLSEHYQQNNTLLAQGYPDPYNLNCDPWRIVTRPTGTTRQGDKFICEYTSVGTSDVECLLRIKRYCGWERSKTDDEGNSGYCPDFELAISLPETFMNLGDGDMCSNFDCVFYGANGRPADGNYRDNQDHEIWLPDMVLGYGEEMTVQPYVGWTNHDNGPNRMWNWLFDVGQPQQALRCQAPPVGGWTDEDGISDKFACKCNEETIAPTEPQPIACAPTSIGTVPSCTGSIRTGPGDRLCGQESFNLFVSGESFWNVNPKETTTITVPGTTVDDLPIDDQFPPPTGNLPGNSWAGDCSTQYSNSQCGAEIRCDQCTCDETLGNETVRYNCVPEACPDDPLDFSCESCDEKCCGPGGVDSDGDCRENPIATSGCCPSDSAPNCTNGQGESRCSIRTYGTNPDGSPIYQTPYQSPDFPPPTDLIYSTQREIHVSTVLPYLGSIHSRLVEGDDIPAVFDALTPHRGPDTAPDSVPWYNFHDGEANGWLNVTIQAPPPNPAAGLVNSNNQSITPTKLPFFFPFLGGIQDATSFVRDCLTSAAVYDPETGTTTNNCNVDDLQNPGDLQLADLYSYYDESGNGLGGTYPSTEQVDSANILCEGDNIGEISVFGNTCKSAPHEGCSLDNNPWIKGITPSSVGTDPVEIPQLAQDYDPGSPKLPTLFSSNPSWMDATYNVNGIPNPGWISTYVNVAEFNSPGEVVVPPSGYDIGHGCEVMVIHADSGSISIKYTREDNVVYGYTVQVEGLSVDGQIVDAYNRLNNEGRQFLPALTAGQTLGSGSGQVRVIIRDTGTYMDPRSQRDWW